MSHAKYFRKCRWFAQIDSPRHEKRLQELKGPAFCQFLLAAIEPFCVKTRRLIRLINVICRYELLMPEPIAHLRATIPSHWAPNCCHIAFEPTDGMTLRQLPVFFPLALKWNRRNVLVLMFDSSPQMAVGGSTPEAMFSLFEVFGLCSVITLMAFGSLIRRGLTKRSFHSGKIFHTNEIKADRIYSQPHQNSPSSQPSFISFGFISGDVIHLPRRGHLKKLALFAYQNHSSSLNCQMR